MKKTLLALSILIISGCATQAVLPSKAKTAPEQRIYSYQQKSSVNDAVLIVVRDSGYLGSGCDTGVYLNGKRSATLEPGEKVNFYLTAGEWSVGMKGEGKLCISDAIPTERDITLQSGTTKAVRLFADPSGNVDIKNLPNE